MKLDFSPYPLRDEGFSAKPMTGLVQEPLEILGAITEMALIETGDRASREQWQRAQLRNLVRHALARSGFWRARLGGASSSDIELGSLPVLTRQELRRQVETEGPLLRPGDGLPTHAHATSGSSGVPVRFFYSDFNARFNVIRSTAQHFLDGQDLSLNRTRIKQADAPLQGGLGVETASSWIGSLTPLIKTGSNRQIEYFALNDQSACLRLVDELKKQPIGYLICNPRLVDTLASRLDLGFLREAGTAMWIPLSEEIDPDLIRRFAELDIPVRANYSSEEVGMIGAECNQVGGYYHVATSNVMVEVIDRTREVDGVNLGAVLVTHLHSYATPFIRYELGDLACLADKCPCGHDGPTIHSLQGRASSVLKHRDGRLSSFMIRGRQLAAVVDFSEFRIRQTAFDKVVIEIGGRAELTAGEVGAITAFLRERAGPEFEIEVRACTEIDWGQSRKRPGFRCEI